MPEVSDENNFNVTINDNKYHVTVSYEGVYVSHYKIESNEEYLFTISMGEEGNWHAEDKSPTIDESVIEKIGRAIEEYDDKPIS